MPRKKGTNYWGEKQEALIHQWMSATTQQEFTRIYEALQPSVNWMVNQIMQKYFNVPPSRWKELQQDTVNHIFLRLRYYYDKDTKKSFSYCGTISRNYMH